jgi:hypothetical protein
VSCPISNICKLLELHTGCYVSQFRRWDQDLREHEVPSGALPQLTTNCLILEQAVALAQLMGRQIKLKRIKQLRGSIRVDRKEFTRDGIVYEIDRDPEITKVSIVKIGDHG